MSNAVDKLSKSSIPLQIWKARLITTIITLQTCNGPLLLHQEVGWVAEALG